MATSLKWLAGATHCPPGVCPCLNGQPAQGQRRGRVWVAWVYTQCRRHVGQPVGAHCGCEYKTGVERAMAVPLGGVQACIRA